MSVPVGGPSVRSTEVLEQLARIVYLVAGRPTGEVLPERTFVEELRIDSLAMVEILEGAARHFGLRIEDEDAKYFVRVGDLVAYLAERM
jgi:acyl carrier protein